MADQKYVPMIGVDMLHYAKVTLDSTEGYTAEKPVPIPGATEIGFNRNAQLGAFYADNILYDSAVSDGDFDIAVSCADVPPELQSVLFGYDYAEGEMKGTELKSDYVALQYRIQKSNGEYRYVTIYKAKAVPKEETVTTKGGSLNFQTNGFSLKGAARMKDKAYYRIVDSDDPNLPAGVADVLATKWFTDIDWQLSATA